MTVSPSDHQENAQTVREANLDSAELVHREHTTCMSNNNKHTRMIRLHRQGSSGLHQSR